MEVIFLQFVILFFLFLYFIGYFFYCVFYFLLPLFSWGAFFARIDDESLDNLINLADIKPGQKVLDLGSGDGKIVIKMAKKEAVAYGYEINPFLVWISQIKIKKAGLMGRALVYRKNFWYENLSGFDMIVLFGIKFIMADLEKKLKTELKPGTIIISKYFTFPNLKQIKTLGQVHLYEI